MTCKASGTYLLWLIENTRRTLIAIKGNLRSIAFCNEITRTFILQDLEVVFVDLIGGWTIWVRICNRIYHDKVLSRVCKVYHQVSSQVRCNYFEKLTLNVWNSLNSKLVTIWECQKCSHWNWSVINRVPYLYQKKILSSRRAISIKNLGLQRYCFFIEDWISSLSLVNDPLIRIQIEYIIQKCWLKTDRCSTSAYFNKEFWNLIVRYWVV